MVTSAGSHAGTWDWDSEALSGITPYAFEVSYTCGQARRFQHVTSDQSVYETHVKTCLWDQSWTPSGVIRQMVAPLQLHAHS